MLIKHAYAIKDGADCLQEDFVDENVISGKSAVGSVMSANEIVNVSMVFASVTPSKDGYLDLCMTAWKEQNLLGHAATLTTVCITKHVSTDNAGAIQTMG